MKQKLLFSVLAIFFFVNSYSQAVANQPGNIIQCGNEVFNLTEQTPVILENQDPQFFVVTYFVNAADAENNVNPIANPQQFVSNGQQQTIFARVDSLSDDSYDITQFNITWTSWVDIPANSPGQVTVCDDGSGFVTLDLTVYLAQITAGVAGLTVTFHPNEWDVWPGLNPVEDPSNFVMPINQHNLFFRVANAEGCVNIGEMFFTVVECTDNTLSGTLTYDAENNDCASGTTPGAYIMMALTHNNDVYYAFTDANGNYTFTNVPDGECYVYVSGQGPFTFSTSPASYTVTESGELTDYNFCLEEPEPANDAIIIITPSQTPRPGMPITYNILIMNYGNTVLNGNVTLQFDDTKLVYVGSNPTMSLSGDVLTVPYTNLTPLAFLSVAAHFTVMTPPTVNQGTPITVVGNVTPLDGDIHPINNQYICTRLANNSMDPNDITCREGEFITEEQADEYLHYVIRFQNTGNADALNIRVEDILDEKLDPATFQPLVASHDYRVEMVNNEVNFIFEDINLPGEDNEPESHGFVAYRIKARPNVQLGDIFEATAAIFFDFNEPVITNTATTTIQNVADVKEAFANAFVVYPNPASHIVNIQANDISASTVDMTIVNVLGKTVMSNTLQMQGSAASFDVSSLDKGLYFITIASEGKSVTKKLVIK